MFYEQMAWLKSHAQVMPLSALVETLSKRRAFPDCTVVLTFDDGFQDFAEQAAPMLLRHGFPATVFLPTGWCGRTNAWPGQPAWVEPQPLMDWKTIAELTGKGFDFGGHSVSHPSLTDIPSQQVEQELAECKRTIEAHTGVAPRHFCYPYGKWNDSVRRAVKLHYAGACSTAAGLIESASDAFSLPRVDAHYVKNHSWFRSMFTRRFATYIATRRVIRRLRRQPEGYLSRG
jgi:peptidoglycan/xylan/chitin deacetylase (PgdA/CDA1 family)